MEEDSGPRKDGAKKAEEPQLQELPRPLQKSLTLIVCELAEFKNANADLMNSVNVCQDLLNILKRDPEESYPVRRTLGRWAIVKKDLIPLSCAVHLSDLDNDQKSVILFEVAKVLAWLLMPVDEQVESLEVKRILQEHLLDIKQAFTAQYVKHTSSAPCYPLEPFASFLLNCIESREASLRRVGADQDRSTDENYTNLELILTLFRNLLHPPVGLSGSAFHSKNMALHSRVITALDEVDFFMAFVVLFSRTESVTSFSLGLQSLAMQVLSFCYRNVEAAELSKLISVSPTEVSQMLIEERKSKLGSILQREKVQRTSSKRSDVGSSRWKSRFGGLLKVEGASNSLGGGSLKTADITRKRGASPITKHVEYMITASKGKRTKARPKSLPKKMVKASMGVSDLDMETADSSTIALAQFADKVLKNCYYPLSSRMRDLLREKRFEDQSTTMREDHQAFLSTAQFFLQLSRFTNLERERAQHFSDLENTADTAPYETEGITSADLEQLGWNHVAGVLEVDALFLALDFANNALESKSNYSNLETALSALTEMIYTLILMTRGSDQAATRRARRALEELFQREDFIKLLFSILTSFSPKTMSTKILITGSRLLNEFFKALREAPSEAKYTVRKLHRRNRAQNGLVENELEDNILLENTNDVEEDEGDFFEEEIDVDLEHGAFTDAKVVNNLTLLIRTALAEQRDEDLGLKFGEGETFKLVLKDNSNLRIGVDNLCQLWRLTNRTDLNSKTVSRVSFFGLRHLLLCYECLSEKGNSVSARENSILAQLQSYANEVLTSFISWTLKFPSLAVDMLFIHNKRSRIDYNRVMILGTLERAVVHPTSPEGHWDEEDVDVDPDTIDLAPAIDESDNASEEAYEAVAAAHSRVGEQENLSAENDSDVDLAERVNRREQPTSAKTMNKEKSGGDDRHPHEKSSVGEGSALAPRGRKWLTKKVSSDEETDLTSSKEIPKKRLLKEKEGIKSSKARKVRRFDLSSDEEMESSGSYKGNASNDSPNEKEGPQRKPKTRTFNVLSSDEDEASEEGGEVHVGRLDSSPLQITGGATSPGRKRVFPESEQIRALTEHGNTHFSPSNHKHDKARSASETARQALEEEDLSAAEKLQRPKAVENAEQVPKKNSHGDMDKSTIAENTEHIDHPDADSSDEEGVFITYTRRQNMEEEVDA